MRQLDIWRERAHEGQSSPIENTHQGEAEHQEEDKYLSPGPVLASALDLFLNKAGLIKIISLAARVLPQILEFSR